MHLYQPLIEAELALGSSLESKSSQDLLFLIGGTLANSFTVKERLAILEELNKNNGSISNEFISKLVGFNVEKHCNSRVEDAYDFSRKDFSLEEASIEWNRRESEKAFALFSYIAITAGMGYTANMNNPPPNYGNLDPNSYYDKMELNALTGQTGLPGVGWGVVLVRGMVLLSLTMF